MNKKVPISPDFKRSLLLLRDAIDKAIFEDDSVSITNYIFKFYWLHHEEYFYK